MDKELTITLKTSDWNIVLNGLASRPYGEVAQLINKLVGQIEAQTKNGEQENEIS